MADLNMSLDEAGRLVDRYLKEGRMEEADEVSRHMIDLAEGELAA